MPGLFPLVTTPSATPTACGMAEWDGAHAWDNATYDMMAGAYQDNLLVLWDV